jgi:hypothetical protein
MPLAPGIYAFRKARVAHYIGGKMECGPTVNVTAGMVNDPHVIDLVNAKELTYGGPILPATKLTAKAPSPRARRVEAAPEGNTDLPKKKKHW